jgi:ribonucleotide monophosphatase NagD (HAD superfamily)
LAAYYAAQGGDVVSLGKPNLAIYRMALDILGVPSGRVLAIGDSLHTDIAGAANAGIDSLWIQGGIHWDATQGDFDRAAGLAGESGLNPAFTMDRLIWA